MFCNSKTKMVRSTLIQTVLLLRRQNCCQSKASRNVSTKASFEKFIDEPSQPLVQTQCGLYSFCAHYDFVPCCQFQLVFIAHEFVNIIQKKGKESQLDVLAPAYFLIYPYNPYACNSMVCHPRKQSHAKLLPNQCQ